MTLECAIDTYDESGAAADDAVDGDIPVNIDGVVDVATAADYTVSY